MKTKPKILFITALVVLFVKFSLAQTAKSPVTVDNIPLQKIDSLFQNWNKKDEPGGVVAIISNHEVIYKKAFGMADIGRKIPNSIESAFDLASMAKQFTGMCIALLEEQGKLSVEDDILKYYPEFQFGKTIRIKNLLDHSSGIREAYVLAVLSGKVNLKGEVPKRYNTKKYLFEVLKRERDLNFTPGDEMVYTNVNYILLGDIVERISGMSLRKFADSAIFKPLKMTHTVFRDKPKMKGPTEAAGYLFTGKKFKKRTPDGGLVGDHNLISTLDDLILWDKNFYDNKLGKRDPKLIKRICSTSLLNNGDTTHYGYGLFVNRDRSLLKIGHGGDNGMHTTIHSRFPNEKFSVICLSNSSRFYDIENKARAIADVLLSDRFKKVSRIEAPEKFIAVSKEDLKRKEGLYVRIDKNGLGMLRKIMYRDSALYTTPYYYGKGEKISPVSNDHFIYRNDFGMLNIHFTDTLGTVMVTSQWRDRPAVDFFPVKKDMKIRYSDFKGSYFNSSTGAKIKVRSKKDKIVARKGIIRIPLIPFDENIFYATQNDALLLFERGTDGRVTGMKINASDFRNFKFTKK
jgi:CubicO group peptidase (beta-lactamase class C family)